MNCGAHDSVPSGDGFEPMQKTSIHHLAASPAAVAAAMDTSAFLLARAAHDPAHVSSHVARMGSLEVRVESQMHARSRTGSIDRSRRETSCLSYCWAGDRRSVQWTWTGTTVVPVEVRGTWTLSAEGTGTRLRSVTEVTVKARLVGRLVEGIIARQLESAEAALPRDIQDQLD